MPLGPVKPSFNTLPNELLFNVLDKLSEPDPSAGESQDPRSARNRTALEMSVLCHGLEGLVNRRKVAAAIKAESRRTDSLKELLRPAENGTGFPTIPSLPVADRTMSLQVLVDRGFTLTQPDGQDATARQEFSHFVRTLKAIAPGPKQLLHSALDDEAHHLMGGLINQYATLKSQRSSRGKVRCFALEAIEELQKAILAFEHQDLRVDLAAHLCGSVRQFPSTQTNAVMTRMLDWATGHDEAGVARFKPEQQGLLLGVLALQRDLLGREDGADARTTGRLIDAISALHAHPDAFMRAAIPLFACMPDLPEGILHQEILGEATNTLQLQCLDVLGSGCDAANKAALVHQILLWELSHDLVAWTRLAGEMLSRLPAEALLLPLQTVAYRDPHGASLGFDNMEPLVNRVVRHLQSPRGRRSEAPPLDLRMATGAHLLRLAVAGGPVNTVKACDHLDKLVDGDAGALTNAMRVLTAEQRSHVEFQARFASRLSTETRNRLELACHAASQPEPGQAMDLTSG